MSGMADRLPPPNLAIARLTRRQYRVHDVVDLQQALAGIGALDFYRLESGLFSASPGGGDGSQSGYQNVWIRDNAYVAYAHLVRGDTATAVGVARALLAFFHRYRRRLQDIVAGVADPADVKNRPHVRFDGHTLTEIPDQKWSHAQNDALGYFLWLVCLLARRRALPLSPTDSHTLRLLVRYLAAIQFWRDQDSGHWEEVRKVSASSVGAVLAGLRELSALLRESQIGLVDSQAGRQASLGHGDLIAAFSDDANAVGELVEQGTVALRAILPAECVQPSTRQSRRYDAALSFLVYPLRVVDDATARDVLGDIDRHLTGEVGIRRYLGDSYWAPDYESKLPPAERTRDFSDDIESRDQLLERVGDEAQWCIFDSLLSAHYGVAFADAGLAEDHERQVHHLNRALAQITAETAATANRLPELYYLKEGRYVPNPHTPLQWAQANLIVALEQMRKTATRATTP
jgi:GH15 family glucan-1,4-alpha-glucosidase